MKIRRLGSQHLNLPRLWYKISKQIEIARGVLKGRIARDPRKSKHNSFCAREHYWGKGV